MPPVTTPLGSVVPLKPVRRIWPSGVLIVIGAPGVSACSCASVTTVPPTLMLATPSAAVMLKPAPAVSLVSPTLVRPDSCTVTWPVALPLASVTVMPGTSLLAPRIVMVICAMSVPPAPSEMA
ncbi:hypothetical protein D9M72_178100 [compost metagenome]